MIKNLLIAPVAALLLAGSAQAGDLKSLTLQQSHVTTQDTGLRAEVVEVTGRRAPVAIIAQDAIYGGIAGLAIGGGVALLNSGNDWARDLAVGAGAGLIVGGIFGAVDAATSADRFSPVVDNRDRGFRGAFSPVAGHY